VAIVMRYDGVQPTLADDVFLAESATVVGRVVLASQVSVWFGAVLRGDVGTIRIGKRSNVQDLTMIHVTGGVADTEIGEDVTIGHHVVLHGCRVEDACLIGIGAIVLDGAVIGEGSLVGANALVTSGTVVPPRSLVLGSPAKVVRPVRDHEGRLGIDGAKAYVELARLHRGATLV
jgi:carbonic anhydrase/acetyltransferase-like protein (isoleucine patch superfamily)